MDDFGLLVGRYLTALPSLSNEQLSELQLDSKGRLIIAGRFLEDEAHSSGDPGIFVMAVRNDSDSSLVSADGDYAPLQVDENGRLKVVADLEISNSSEKAEDSAHVSEDIGAYVLAVRSDTRPTNANTSASGDYASLFVNVNGELYVHDTDALTKLTEIDTVLDNIYTEQLDQGTTLDNIDTNIGDIETELLDQGTTLDNIYTEQLDQGTTLDSIETELLDQGTTLDNIETSVDNIEADIDSLVHEEDTAHVSGDKGTLPLAVRHDTEGSLVNADGDYAPLQVDADGKLRVRADAELDAQGTEAYDATDSLAVGGDGLVSGVGGTYVDLASVSVAAGETAYVYGWQWDCDQNAEGRLITDDGGDIVVYKVRLNSSALPGIAEHWSESGRIEIAGSATPLLVKVQVKKRSSVGGNANASGSLHVRIR